MDANRMKSHALWFVLSMVLLLLSHILRAARLATLYPRKYNVRRFDLLLGLAMSYTINTVVPYRVGEIVRIMYVGRRCRIRYSFVGATVVAERLSDVIVVGLLSLLLVASAIIPRHQMATASAAMFTIAVSGFLAAFGISRSSAFRRYLWLISSVFRNSIRNSLLDFFWSFSVIVTGGLIGRSRFLTLTPVMWVFYALSYFSFAKSSDFQLREVVLAMLGSPLRSIAASTWSIAAIRMEGRILGFTLTPVLVIILYGLLRERTSIFRVINSLAAGRYVTSFVYSTPIGDRFQQVAEYEAFLVSIFSQRSNILTDFSMTAIADGAVQRLFPGGSDAVTALVEVKDKLLIRKFAIGEAGRKLEVQARWLQQFRDDLPLVEVAGLGNINETFFSYDMPYVPAARDFYDVIHTSTLIESQAVLSQVIDRIRDFHGRTEKSYATLEIVGRYLEEKATRNAEISLRYSREWFSDSGSKYLLNGRECDLADWQYLLNPSWLAAQITDYRTSVIHGDLTIENIIVSKDHPEGFYIIDPNPENIFDSPLIDWAKLMQSLHLGYEGLNKTSTCTWKDGALSLVLARSHAYNELHDFCLQRVRGTLGEEAQREISFHEIINYLRLTPYKIRHAPAKGLAFFCCTSILLRDYLEQYG